MIAINEFDGVVYSLQHATVWRIFHEDPDYNENYDEELEEDKYHLFAEIGDKKIEIAHGKDRGALLQFMKYAANQANQDITLTECAERFDELSSFNLLKYIELDFS